jgi:hypothetical protein
LARCHPSPRKGLATPFCPSVTQMLHLSGSSVAAAMIATLIELQRKAQQAA